MYLLLMKIPDTIITSFKSIGQKLKLLKSFVNCLENKQWKLLSVAVALAMCPVVASCVVNGNIAKWCLPGILQKTKSGSQIGIGWNIFGFRAMECWKRKLTNFFQGPTRLPLNCSLRSVNIDATPKGIHFVRFTFVCNIHHFMLNIFTFIFSPLIFMLSRTVARPDQRCCLGSKTGFICWVSLSAPCLQSSVFVFSIFRRIPFWNINYCFYRILRGERNERWYQ